MADKAETSEPTAQAMDRLRQLVQRAEAGDRAVLPELRQLLDGDAALWRRHGDLAEHAQAAWLNLVAGQNLLLREAVRRRLEELRAELAGPGPSPLERLLADRVVATWLMLQYSDCTYAQARGPQASPAVLRELQRRQESAQGRHLAAIKQLALVRKLLRPGPSPLDLAMRAVPESPAVRLHRSAAPAEGEPVLN